MRMDEVPSRSIRRKMWVMRMLIEAADRVTEVITSNETMSSGMNVPPVKPMSHLDPPVTFGPRAG